MRGGGRGRGWEEEGELGKMEGDEEERGGEGEAANGVKPACV